MFEHACCRKTVRLSRHQKRLLQSASGGRKNCWLYEKETNISSTDTRPSNVGWRVMTSSNQILQLRWRLLYTTTKSIHHNKAPFSVIIVLEQIWTKYRTSDPLCKQNIYDINHRGLFKIGIYHPLSTVSGWFRDQYGNPIFFPYLPSTSYTNLTRIWAFFARKKGDKNKTELASILLNRLAVLKTVKDSPCRLVRHRLSTACLFIRIVACPVLSLYSYMCTGLLTQINFTCSLLIKSWSHRILTTQQKVLIFWSLILGW